MSNRRQPQRLPPPIMHGGEAIDSELILKELPEDQALVLWKTVRSVRLWAELPEGERAGAFSASAHDSRMHHLRKASFPDEVLVSLAKAATVLQPRVRAAAVAMGCRTVASWALQRGAVATAIEFQQAAAVALPTEAELAFEVAKIARTRGEYARAETWYRQAISRARRARNWYEFSRAYIGLGTVAVLRGNYPQAKRSLIRGVRAAKRFAIRPLVAAGYHELAVLAIQRQSPVEVTRFSRLALEAYGSTHPRLPALAFDYGVFLLSSGYFEEALRTFRSIPDEFGRPVDRLARAAAVARAAAAAKEVQTYESAWSEAERLLEDPTTASGAATAYLSLARAAEFVGDMERAEQAALDAQRLAAEKEEANIEFAAVGLLESIRNGVAAQAVRAEPAPPKVRRMVREFEARSEAVGWV
jgi:tetratricopeptide (TPR) repeat protein